MVDIPFTMVSAGPRKEGSPCRRMPLGLGFRSEPVHPVDGSTAHMMGADLASVSADRADRETINLLGSE
jgi:hypothetical protein